LTQYINPRNYKFCPVCGSHLSHKYVTDEKTNRLVCGDCGFIFYINPTPAVAVILMKENQIVLVKRKFEPHKGGWSLPAGFMEYDETAEDTAIREVKEETNLDIRITELFGIYPGFDDPRVHVVLIAYWGEIVDGHLVPGDDAEEVNFFPLNQLPGNIAFSAHRTILKQLVRDENQPASPLGRFD